PILVVTLILLVVVVVWWRMHKKTIAPPPAAPVQPVPSLPPTAPPPVATAAADGGTAATGTPQKPLRSPADDELEKAGLKRIRVDVNGPLETAVVGVVGPEAGPRLVQVMVRSLVWWLAVPADLRRGDVLEALYEERAGEDPI